MKGLRLGLGLSGAASAFNPASVMGANSVWYDPSDLSTMFKDTAGTQPVTADGDAVARINDKSGNGNHWTQAASGKWPIYHTDGTHSWLLLDAIDDGYVTGTGLTWAAASDLFLAVRATHDPCVLAYDFTNAGGKGMGVLQASDSTDSTSFGVGTPSNLVDGVAVTDTRSALSAALLNGDHVFESQDAAITFSQLAFGLYAGFQFGGRFYGGIIVPAQSSANRAKLRTWLGAKAGLTL